MAVGIQENFIIKGIDQDLLAFEVHADGDVTAINTIHLQLHRPNPETPAVQQSHEEGGISATIAITINAGPDRGMKNTLLQGDLIHGGTEDLRPAAQQIICVVYRFLDELLVMLVVTYIGDIALDLADNAVKEIMFVLRFQTEEEHAGKGQTEEENPYGTQRKSKFDSFHGRIEVDLDSYILGFLAMLTGNTRIQYP